MEPSPSGALDADVDEERGWRQRGPVLGKQVNVAVPCGERSQASGLLPTTLQDPDCAGHSPHPTPGAGPQLGSGQALLGNSWPGEQGLGAQTPSFPSPPTPPTLLQAVERQCKLAHKVIGGGSVIIFHHKPDQHQLRSPQLELQSLPPAGVEA